MSRVPDKPNVWCICATCGRHTVMERSLGFFIAQDYDGEHTLLVYNNSDVEQELDLPLDLPSNKHILLINQHVDSQTDKQYTNLGAIYNDAFGYVSIGCELLTHWDDDDIFMPNHITEGVAGYKRAKELQKGMVAYKPERSWFRHPKGLDMMGNNLEPSVFVEPMHIYDKKYALTTTDQHLQWFRPLLDEQKMFVDPNGLATLVYNWGDMDIPTFKTSGDCHNPRNFDNYRMVSREHGDHYLTPWKPERIEAFYNSLNTLQHA